MEIQFSVNWSCWKFGWWLGRSGRGIGGPKRIYPSSNRVYWLRCCCSILGCLFVLSGLPPLLLFSWWLLFVLFHYCLLVLSPLKGLRLLGLDVPLEQSIQSNLLFASFSIPGWVNFMPGLWAFCIVFWTSHLWAGPCFSCYNCFRTVGSKVSSRS